MTFYILSKRPFLATQTEIWNKHTFGLLDLRTALLSQKGQHKNKKSQADELKCIATLQAGNDEKS